MLDLYRKIDELRNKHHDLVVITVTEKEGMSPADVAKKMVVSDTKEFFGTVGGGAIEHYAIEKAFDIIKNNRTSMSEKYVLNDKKVEVDKDDVILPMACGGKVTLFYEFIGPKQYVYIYGGGHCGKALSKILQPLGFYVTVIDYRKEVIDELIDVDEKVVSEFTDYVDKMKPNSYVVVATPSHLYDYDVLDKIFDSKYQPAYFGMLCSKKKINDYLSKIKEKHPDLSLDNFYAPIGLDIGGTSPEEIAISIASEILSIYYHKEEKNAHMRDRK